MLRASTRDPLHEQRSTRGERNRRHSLTPNYAIPCPICASIRFENRYGCVREGG